ncbi:MAG: N-succinylarginine dihydrolase, partial [Novosphingobium sp.]
CTEHGSTRSYIERLTASNGPIRQVLPVDVRQSMANGGGPACLRLRVVADPATIDPRFLLDETKADAIEKVISQHWPETIEPFDLQFVSLEEMVVKARQALLATLGLDQLA